MSRVKTFASAVLLGALLSACSGTPPVSSTAPASPEDDAQAQAVPAQPDDAALAWDTTAPANILSALKLKAGEYSLTSVKPLAASNGLGPIELNRSNGGVRPRDGRPLTLNRVVYAQGFGTHASSMLNYNLKGLSPSCSTFAADVGVDDEVGSGGSVVFQVYVDGRKKYDSGLVTGSSATQKVQVSLTGGTTRIFNLIGPRELRLTVTDGGNGNRSDHADWANPRIICPGTGGPPSGSVDPSFGQNGTANVGGVDALLEPDNAVLIADTLNGDFVLRRLKPGGSVQQVVTNFGGQDSASALVRQPDGKIVVVGSSNNRFAVARYNTDLSLDVGFGLGGRVITSVGSLGNAGADAVALQPDGRIVAVGTTLRKVGMPSTLQSQDLATVRYTASGQPDPTFGTGGISVLGFDAGSNSSSEDEARAVVIQAGGGVVIAGKSDRAGGGRLALLTRLTPGGGLDTGFGSGGAVFGSDYGIYNDVAQEAGGNLVVVGYKTRWYGVGDVQRYSPNGSPLGGTDITFTPDTATAFNINTLAHLLVQPDGKLLISGISQYALTGQSMPGPTQTVLARLNPNLSLDTSFGTGGKKVVPITTLTDGYTSPAITPLRQNDGKIVVVGQQTVRLFP